MYIEHTGCETRCWIYLTKDRALMQTAMIFWAPRSLWNLLAS